MIASKREKRLQRLVAVFILGSAAISSGCGRNATGPLNHAPVLVTLTVFPQSVGVSDSVVVTCVATDQDADTLVYDWETDLRLRIKGAPPGYPIKSNSPNNTETFYPAYVPSSLDTVWVACTVRDRVGGGVTRAVNFTVHP